MSSEHNLAPRLLGFLLASAVVALLEESLHEHGMSYQSEFEMITIFSRFSYYIVPYLCHAVQSIYMEINIPYMEIEIPYMKVKIIHLEVKIPKIKVTLYVLLFK